MTLLNRNIGSGFGTLLLGQRELHYANFVLLLHYKERATYNYFKKTVILGAKYATSISQHLLGDAHS